MKDLNFAEDIVKEILQDFDRISEERKSLESGWGVKYEFCSR